VCLAVPGRVASLETDAGLRLARVEFGGGVHRRVCVETLERVAPGDWVLVHAGVALQILDAARAREALAGLGVAGEGPA
jgi:hydrogenase expression/formation protein HypC